MIRFLQKDSRAIKFIFFAIIAVASITMVITLVPGIFAGEETSTDTYATIHGSGVLGRIFGPTQDIHTPEVRQIAARMAQQQHLPDFALPFLMPRAAQALIQREILLQEANRLGLTVTNADLRHELETGPFSAYLFPKGQYVGDDRYADFVQNAFNMSRENFEHQIKNEIEINRLEAMVTGGVFVSDKEAADAYRQQGAKVKFQYAVLNADDLRKQINPTDAELEIFFKQNAARYKNAIPETRKLQYISFTPDQAPGGAPQISDAEVQRYYNDHLKDYQVADQVRVRHILIAVPKGADAKTDAAAKAKAEAILKQLRAGGDFAELAKKNSDDPGSKAQGGELGFLQHGATVPEFDKTAFALKPGQISDVIKTQFGYHILQTEEKQTAHTKPLAEVKTQIVATLTRQAEAQQQSAYAQKLAAEAKANGLQKTADAHHLQLVTTGDLAQGAIIPGLADSTKLMVQAFTDKKGAPPAVAPTGEGYAVFQVASITPAHAPTFAEYKTHLLDDFREQQVPQLLARKTNELAAKAKADGNLDKAAAAEGATVKTSDLVGRDAQVPDIGGLAQLAPQVFTMNTGQISNAINTGRTGVVLKLTDKQEPSAAEVQSNLAKSREQLLNDRREELFAVFVTNLTSQYEKAGRVRMNKRAQEADQPSAPGRQSTPSPMGMGG